MTDNRREFLTASMLGLATAFLATREAAAAPAAKQIAQRDTPAVNLEGWQITASEVSYPPGEASGKHRHPGFVIGYVLEGQYRFAVNDQAPAVLGPARCFLNRLTHRDRFMRCLAMPARPRPQKSLQLCSRRRGIRLRSQVDRVLPCTFVPRSSQGGVPR